jgi:hypothetical protein
VSPVADVKMPPFPKDATTTNKTNTMNWVDSLSFTLLLLSLLEWIQLLFYLPHRKVLLRPLCSISP